VLAIPAVLLAAIGKPSFKRMLQASAPIPILWWLIPRVHFRGGGSSGGRSSGSSSGGGFRGGGGSFGGGGSSGRW